MRQRDRRRYAYNHTAIEAARTRKRLTYEELAKRVRRRFRVKCDRKKAWRVCMGVGSLETIGHVADVLNINIVVRSQKSGRTRRSPR